MNCQQYTTLLASGQLGPRAPWPLRARAACHTLICAHCRRFARNDAALTALLQGWRESLQAPGASPPPDGPKASEAGADVVG